MSAAAIMGHNGGSSIAAKEGPDYFRQLAEKRKTKGEVNHRKYPSSDDMLYGIRPRPSQQRKLNTSLHSGSTSKRFHQNLPNPAQIRL